MIYIAKRCDIQASGRTGSPPTVDAGVWGPRRRRAKGASTPHNSGKRKALLNRDAASEDLIVKPKRP